MFGIKLYFSRYGWTHLSFSNSRHGSKKQIRSPDASLRELKVTLRRHGVSLVCWWGFTNPLSVFTGCPKCPQKPKASYRDAKTIASEWSQHSYVCTQRQDTAPFCFFWQQIRRDAVGGGGGRIEMVLGRTKHGGRKLGRETDGQRRKRKVVRAYSFDLVGWKSLLFPRPWSVYATYHLSRCRNHWDDLLSSNLQLDIPLINREIIT